MGCLPTFFGMSLRFHRHPVRMARISEILAALAALEACQPLDMLRADEAVILLVAVAVMVEVALTVRQGAGVALWAAPWVLLVAVQV